MFFKIILLIFLTKFVEIKCIYKESDYSSNGLKGESKLLVILVDGFRWDYVERDSSLKGFPLIAENGVHAEYVKPIFPAASYPNWYAITTGLYAESHGMIGNYMFDQRRDEMFWMAPDQNASHIYWWNQTEPLWTNAEKQGVKTSMYLWDGCQVNISGIEVSLCHQYRGIYDPKEVDSQTRSYINTILDDFSQNKYRLSMLYYESTDHSGHKSGPSSDELMKAVQQIDAILYDLFHEINDKKLNESLNVVIVSDHGMTDIKGFKKIHLEDFIDFNDIELMLEWMTRTQILPKPGKEKEVLKQLSSIEGIKAYGKSDIPEHFHFKNNRLVLPILVTADSGYYIETPRVNNPYNIKPSPGGDSQNQGDHGYDHESSDMRAIMYGFGPAFKRNFTSGQIEMVDHYNLFCHILGITPHPNNGTFARVNSFLKNNKIDSNNNNSNGYPCYPFLIVMALLLIKLF